MIDPNRTSTSEGSINLPRPLTPLIGRDREIREISELLERPEVRLLVLTGPGGTGKTRLGLEAAYSAVRMYPDGATFVPLAPVRDPAGLIPAIAARVGVREAGERALADLLVASLRDRKSLLLLDNFEQIVAAAPSLVDLLAECPDIDILVTSRAVLRVSGEYDYPVPPLALPESEAQFEQSDAVQLFAQRATAVRPDFELDETTLPVIAAICRQLDGLPLAIELAAARLRHIPLPSLYERLGQRLSLLSDGARDQPLRLQTMRNAIAWSYDLLEPAHQDLFQALSLFTGGFRLDAASAVSGISDEFELFDSITTLVDNSLLRQLPTPDDDPRYRMLEVIREYGLEHLEQSGRAIEVQDRMVEWSISLVEQGWPAMARRVDQQPWLARYDLEMANFRVIMSWLAELEDSERLVRLAGGLFWYWYVRGQFSEGRSWLERALTLPRHADYDRDRRARAIYGAGILSHFQGDDTRAVPLVEQALVEWEALGDEWGQGISRLLLGIIAEDDGDYEPARDLVRQAIQHTLSAGDAVNNALATYHLGIIYWGLGDLDEAIRLCTHARERQREISDRWGEANSLAFLGIFAALRGDYERSNEHQRESLQLRMGIGTPVETEEIANYFANMAVLAVRCSRPDPAARFLGAEQQIRTAVGSSRKLPERLTYEDASARARDALGDAAFEDAWNAGISAPVAETLGLAQSFDVVPKEDQPEPGSPAAGPRHERLTARELEIVQLMALGLTNAEIAERLFITPGTVRIHVSNVLGKLGAQNRTEAVAIARRRGDLPSA